MSRDYFHLFSFISLLTFPLPSPILYLSEDSSMTPHQSLTCASKDLHTKYNGSVPFDAGRELLINAQYHLYSQVSGTSKSNPTIPGGYAGQNYRRALKTLTNCIQMIECERNLEAIKDGHKQPYGIEFKH
jgi:hypothetical protein